MMEHITESARTIIENGNNAGHDFPHTLRVRELCLYIGSREGGDLEILEASALLHDIGRPSEFEDPQKDHAVISAALAPGILSDAGFPAWKIPSVIDAIASHRYSSNACPPGLEAKILQDADRLDISGALGTAMTFAYSGAMGRSLYHPDDPMAERREPDGNKYAVDHILSKLMRLPLTMHTETARDMAVERNRFLKYFIEQFMHEITIGSEENE